MALLSSQVRQMLLSKTSEKTTLKGIRSIKKIYNEILIRESLLLVENKEKLWKLGHETNVEIFLYKEELYCAFGG